MVGTALSFIVVGPQILELLKQHREKQLANKTALGERYRDEGWVFCHPDSGKPYDPKVFYKHFKKICVRIGLPASLRLHDLRHDYVTARRDRGDSFEEIQQALDHEFVATTRGYDHEHYERMKKAALDVECSHHFPMPPA